jgi:hypothetical protein
MKTLMGILMGGALALNQANAEGLELMGGFDIVGGGTQFNTTENQKILEVHKDDNREGNREPIIPEDYTQGTLGLRSFLRTTYGENFKIYADTGLTLRFSRNEEQYRHNLPVEEGYESYGNITYEQLFCMPDISGGIIISTECGNLLFGLGARLNHVRIMKEHYRYDNYEFISSDEDTIIEPFWKVGYEYKNEDGGISLYFQNAKSTAQLYGEDCDLNSYEVGLGLMTKF